MSVYVDDAKHPYGRMKMCHMIADTQAELMEMATRIGVAHRHVQYPNTFKEHFDICGSKRALAIRAGAIAVSSKDIVLKMRARPDHPGRSKRFPTD